MATEFSQPELDQMSFVARRYEPLAPTAVEFEITDKAISVSCALIEGYFLATFMRANETTVTYVFNPPVAWMLALIVVELMKVGRWKQAGFAIKAAKVKKSVRRNRELSDPDEVQLSENLPPSPEHYHLLEGTSVIAVTGGGSANAAIFSLRLQDSSTAFLGMNSAVAYRLFIALTSAIEGEHWVGSDGRLLPRAAP